MVLLHPSALILLAATTYGVLAADSHLMSRRLPENPSLRKRFLDDNGNYNITIIHVNDVHSHLDEFTSSGTDCAAGKTCYGGYARLKTKIDELRATYDDSLVLNAGDEFQVSECIVRCGRNLLVQSGNVVLFIFGTIRDCRHSKFHFDPCSKTHYKFSTLAQ